MAKEYPIEELRKLVHHEPDTGKLLFKHRDVSMFSYTKNPLQACNSWNARYANKEIKNFSSGYNRVVIFDCHYPAHRVMWALHYGEWPKGQIDHINGVKLDNSIVNLRVVTDAENSKNMPLRSDNKSGVTGIYRSKNGKKWISEIRVNRKKIYFGTFENFEDAVAVRKAAEIQYGFHENHGRPLTTNANQV